MASCPPSLHLYYSSQIPHTAIAYFCGGNVAPGTWLRYYLLNPFPPFSPPLDLQRTCLLWCVGYDLQHGIMPGPCSYSCVTGKMIVSLQHPGLHMDEFPALDARPQCIFVMPCFISPAGKQLKPQTSFQINTSFGTPLCHSPLVHRAHFHHPALPCRPPPPADFDAKRDLFWQPCMPVCPMGPFSIQCHR